LTDIPGTTSTTSSISVGGSTTNSLEVLGDHDWYAITLTAGQSIQINVTSPGQTVDTYVNVYDASGNNILAHDDDSPTGTNSILGLTAPTTGTYYIDVGAWDDQSTGSYTLSVKAWTPPPVATYDTIANQLISGYWAYSGEGPHHFNVSQGGTITIDIHTLTAAEQTLARAAFAEWHDIIGVNFKEVTSGAQILVTDEEDPTTNGDPSAYTEDTSSGGFATSAHVHISRSWVTSYGVQLPGGGQSLDSYAFQTYIHEIGHALGLGHAGDYNGSATFTTDASFYNDSWATSIMSYFSQTESSYFSVQGFTQNYVMTPMDGDVVAMQQMYGLSTTTRTGNTTYGFHSTADRDVFNATLYPDAAYTIFDSGGTDTLDYSGFSANQVINLNPETFSNVGAGVGNVTIARGTVIENAMGGAGSDTLIGNGAANTLTGNAGSDTLDGRAGADRMIGGAGNDTYVVDNAGDVVTENAGEGTDQVSSSVTYTLAANVENLTLTGSAAINGTGNSLANVLTGNGAANVLNGGAGADKMAGGAGDDTYVVENTSDVVTEGAGAGHDLVKSSVSWVLGANLEDLTLSGAAAIDGTGNTLDNILRGNNSANVLDGGSGNDTLMGNGGNDTLTGSSGNDKLNGGIGADGMTGGSGNDYYYVDNTGDTVSESAGAGNDTVKSTISWTLGANFEQLTLSGSAIIDGTGNSLDNIVRGNNAANTLDGGAGADTIFGNGGNDTLIGGAGRDTMVGGSGNDTFVFHTGDLGGATTSTADRITDFTSGQDEVDLSALDANSLLAGDQGFSFVGTNAFSHSAGELRYEHIGSSTFVEGDLNGDGVADFMIRFDGSHSFVQSDFLL
jgi:serralysin